MEPPRGFAAKAWNFICFLPFFIGLLIIGIIKGAVLCPLILIIITAGNFAVILALWPVHLFYTCYCLWSSKQLGPQLKLTLSVCVLVILLIWPVIGLISSVIGGAAYGFLQPLFATFQAVGGEKTSSFYHIINDGIADTVQGSFTIIRDVRDVLYHSYYSVMDDLQQQGTPGGKYYEIRLLYIPLALLALTIGIPLDFGMVGIIAAYKVPYMLLKGWRRLFHDCIGREGPFLETICVPLAGLALMLWPFAVCTAFMGSVLAGVILGAYAGVVVYEESSFWMGLKYIVAAWSIFDEYSNDVLDLPEGSCYPRPQYRKKTASMASSSSSFSRPDSFKKTLSRTNSNNAPAVEANPLELAGSLFKACQHNGEIMVSEGVITLKDIEDAKSNKDSGQVISIGLPAYCILQTVLRSAKANSPGLVLFDNVTEVIPTNRPKDAFYQWFLNPLLIIKDQIKAENLSDSEEEYIGKLVLLSGDPERLRKSITEAPESERRRAELEALARRLRGITKSMSRFPTYKRRFESSMKIILEELANKNGNSIHSEGMAPQRVQRSKSMLERMFSENTFKNKTGNAGDQEAHLVNSGRDIENQ